MRCGWCGKDGHNRKGCAHLKQFVVNNPNSYQARSFNNRSKPRCSYCSSTEHNRTTCERFNEYIHAQLNELIDCRKWVCENLAQQGISVGAIIKAKVYERKLYAWTDDNCLVEGIDWERLFDNGSRPIKLIPLSGIDKTTAQTNTLHDIIARIPSDKAYEYNHALMTETNPKVLKEYEAYIRSKGRGRSS